MSTAVWPAGLPQNLLVSGYTEQLANNLVVAEFDIGPSQTRRRSMSAPVNTAGSILCTVDQIAIFKTFYNDVLISGSQRFSWINPISRTPVLMQFNPAQQPSITANGGTVFTVSMSLLVHENIPIT